MMNTPYKPRDSARSALLILSILSILSYLSYLSYLILSYLAPLPPVIFLKFSRTSTKRLTHAKDSSTRLQARALPDALSAVHTRVTPQCSPA